MGRDKIQLERIFARTKQILTHMVGKTDGHGDSSIPLSLPFASDTTNLYFKLSWRDYFCLICLVVDLWLVLDFLSHGINV